MKGNHIAAAEELQGTIDSYLEIDGIEAAGLITADGLLAAWTGGDGMNPEAISAHAASAFSSLRSLAAESGTRLPRIINLGLPGRDLILSHLTRDLILILLGREDAVRNLVRGGL